MICRLMDHSCAISLPSRVSHSPIPIFFEPLNILGSKPGCSKLNGARCLVRRSPRSRSEQTGAMWCWQRSNSDKALVQDPVEARPLVLSREQFESTWTGELLLFTKRANLRLQDLKFDFTWFIPAIVKYRVLLGEVLVASFFFSCLLCSRRSLRKSSSTRCSYIKASRRCMCSPSA